MPFAVCSEAFEVDSIVIFFHLGMQPGASHGQVKRPSPCVMDLYLACRTRAAGGKRCFLCWGSPSKLAVHEARVICGEECHHLDPLSEASIPSLCWRETTSSRMPNLRRQAAACRQLILRGCIIYSSAYVSRFGER